MQHYFIDKEHKESDFFEFEETFLDNSFCFKSCDSIFSKDCIDYGTKVLLECIFNNVNLSGKVLDIGCGYGAIGIVLSKLFPAIKITMCDINNTAVSLSKFNVIKNKCKNVENVLYSNAYENINEKFDFVISNPPIKAGKENLLNILVSAKNHLNENGSLIFVIKKKHGEDSVKKQLEKEYSGVEILKREKGYYILKADK